MPPSRTGKTQSEEQDEILAQAERFDRLLAEPGWAEILALMAQRVDATIVGATTPPENGEGVFENAVAKTIQVTRWDAQRELMDMAQGHIRMILAERDRIKQEREMEERFAQRGETEDWNQI
jgi:hypothetical protein